MRSTSSPSQLQTGGLPKGPQTLAIFIDSGSDVTIIDGEVAHQLLLKWELLPQPVPAPTLDGDVLLQFGC